MKLGYRVVPSFAVHELARHQTFAQTWTTHPERKKTNKKELETGTLLVCDAISACLNDSGGTHDHVRKNYSSRVFDLHVRCRVVPIPNFAVHELARHQTFSQTWATNAEERKQTRNDWKRTRCTLRTFEQRSNTLCKRTEWPL